MSAAARQRIKEASPSVVTGRLISTTESPALSLALDNGENVWLEMTDEQVLTLVEDGIYYLGRRARVIFAQERNGKS